MLMRRHLLLLYTKYKPTRITQEEQNKKRFTLCFHEKYRTMKLEKVRIHNKQENTGLYSKGKIHVGLSCQNPP